MELRSMFQGINEALKKREGEREKRDLEIRSAINGKDLYSDHCSRRTAK